MVNYRIVDRPAFDVAGRQVWISGPDNSQFGRFWEACKNSDLFDRFRELADFAPGPQTGGATLGVSRVEADPARREFYFMVVVEVPENAETGDLERYRVPAGRWAVFECHGPIPEALVASEIYAFTEWLPTSGYIHAAAPEMEVYPPTTEGAPEGESYCEFWLPITAMSET
ncbi:MAG: GyrI-like domain-containing protein [Anaerolineae bacterium]